jgi:hypothetical protein
MSGEQQRPASQRIPAGLAGVLNAPEENRDSAYYSSTDASSKHTSTASGIGINVYHAAQDKTPSPTATNLLPHPMVSPSSHISVASMVSPSSPGASRFDRPLSLESANGLPVGASASIGPDSRRESVDSRINQNFGDLRLSGSPYTSQNQSTTSISGALAQQRNPRSGIEQLATHRISNGYQPSVERTPETSKAARTAPAITGPATSHIARAAEPTKGQAWAFPEEEIQRVPSTPSIANTSFLALDSRRSSVTDSIASSQFTTESRLPPGQRRLDEGLGGPDYQRLSHASGEGLGAADYQRLSHASGDGLGAPDFQRLSQASSEYPSVHHHSLQHKQLSDLASEENSPQNGAQPYSRTPELRVSHKLAERKRRTEMKELFEQLRDLMPQERGSKASKWEILTKAIAEHQRQQDAIKQLSGHCQTTLAEAEAVRREIERLRVENAQLRGSMPSGQSPPSHAAPPQPAPEQFAQDPYRSQRPELPPLRALSGNLPSAPESMTGVQYEGQRPGAFPPDRF